MDRIELHFPVLGTTLPVHHGYALYAALSRQVPALHAADSPISIGPIGGDYLGRGLMQLGPRSRLRCRLPTEAIGLLLPLAGKRFEVAGHKIRLGVPNVWALLPAQGLAAQFVTMKINNVPDPTPEQFLEAVRRRMQEKDIAGTPVIPLVQSGTHAGRHRRRIIRLKDRRVVGFTLHVTDLSAEASLRLQADSPFSRRRMGCGFFVPLREEEQ
jgi:CRISPR-associated protein Cas6